MSPQPPATYAVLGDLHGHLQLALCTLARWQRERETDFSAVFLVGDVGTFIDESQLDNATRKHARDNPCELEFLAQWAVHPQAPWIDAIFRPPPDGLGLNCPVVMVHGNHEGFAHLQNLFPRRRRPLEPVSVDSLPDVDTAGRIKLLPSGWTAVTAQGHTVAGIGGIEPGQRRAKYVELEVIDGGLFDIGRATPAQTVGPSSNSITTLPSSTHPRPLSSAKRARNSGNGRLGDFSCIPTWFDGSSKAISMR